jgi:hypothetical protein
MIGILLTLAAVLLVICLAFCYSERSHPNLNSSEDFPFLDKIRRHKN